MGYPNLRFFVLGDLLGSLRVLSKAESARSAARRRPRHPSWLLGLGFRVQGSGSRVSGVGLRVEGVGFRV